jgi:hypothetical protein
VVGLLLAALSVALGFSFFSTEIISPHPIFLRGTAVLHIEVQNVWTLFFDNCYRRLSRLNAGAVIKFVVIETSSLQV